MAKLSRTLRASAALALAAGVLGAVALAGCAGDGGNGGNGNGDRQPVLSLPTTTLLFGTTRNTMLFAIRNSGGGRLNWEAQASVPWITLAGRTSSSGARADSKLSGTGPADIYVSVDRSSLGPGEHTAQVSVTSNGGNGSVSVTVAVPGAVGPILSVVPTTLDLGADAEVGAFTISNDGGGSLTWSVQTPAGAPWLTVEPASGTGSRNVSVAVSRSGLAPGEYTADITVASNGGNATVSVRALVAGGPVPLLNVVPTLLDYGTATTQQSVAVTNAGGGSLGAWTATPNAPWMTVAPEGGTGPGSFTVTVDRSQLASGMHYGAVTVASDAGTATVNVVLAVTTVLSVAPRSLEFGRVGTTGAFAVTNTGQGLMDWTCTALEGWITLDPASGTNAGTVNVTVSRAGLPPGAHTGTVTVDAGDAGSTTVDVSLAVNHRPVVTSVTPENVRLAPGHTMSVTATASDVDDASLTYTWSASGGTIAGSGASVLWSAPQVPGQYTVTCRVTDPLGASAQRTSDPITVFEIGGIDVGVSSTGP